MITDASIRFTSTTLIKECILRSIHELKISSPQTVILEFTSRTGCNTQEAIKLSVAPAPTAFGNVCCNGASATPNLTRQAIQFVLGKDNSYAINFNGELMGLSPDLQTLKFFMSATPRMG